MSKDPFIPLTNAGQELVNPASQSPASRVLIKNGDTLARKRIRKYDPDALEGTGASVFIIEEGGEIRGLEFKCTCGSHACIRLVTDTDEGEVE